MTMSFQNEICESFMYDSPDEDAWESSNSESDEDEACFWSSSTAINVIGQNRDLSYEDDPGSPCSAFKFKPVREPGIHLDEVKSPIHSGKCPHPGDFFKLIFTVELVGQLVKYTNEYAAAMRYAQPALLEGWFDMNVSEFYKFIGLLMYMALVRVPSVENYWSAESPYHGLWAPDFMTEKRFAQIMSFLRVSDQSTECPGDALWRVRSLMDFVRQQCTKFYQPHQSLLTDLRRVSNSDTGEKAVEVETENVVPC